jgi:HSP20 family protein
VKDIEDAFSRVLEHWPTFGRRWHWPETDPFARFDFPTRLTRDISLPRVDMVETDEGYELTAELPGLTEKDVECSLAGDVLTVKGEKQESTEKKKKGYYLNERRYGSFERRFTVPDDVDVGKLDATVSHGVLKVTMPRTAQAKKAKKIEVKTA